ncbi:hypothetical protein OCH80_06040 [Lactobacillus sp. 23-2]
MVGSVLIFCVGVNLLYQADKAMRKSKEEFYKKAENDRRAR